MKMQMEKQNLLFQLGCLLGKLNHIMHSTAFQLLTEEEKKEIAAIHESVTKVYVKYNTG